MFVSKSDFKLLSAVLVFLWPLGVVFPLKIVRQGKNKSERILGILHDFAIFYDFLDFGDHERAHTHWCRAS